MALCHPRQSTSRSGASVRAGPVARADRAATGPVEEQHRVVRGRVGAMARAQALTGVGSSQRCDRLGAGAGLRHGVGDVHRVGAGIVDGGVLVSAAVGGGGSGGHGDLADCDGGAGGAARFQAGPGVGTAKRTGVPFFWCRSPRRWPTHTSSEAAGSTQRGASGRGEAARPGPCALHPMSARRALEQRLPMPAPLRGTAAANPGRRPSRDPGRRPSRDPGRRPSRDPGRRPSRRESPLWPSTRAPVAVGGRHGLRDRRLAEEAEL